MIKLQDGHYDMFAENVACYKAIKHATFLKIFVESVDVVNSIHRHCTKFIVILKQLSSVIRSSSATHLNFKYHMAGEYVRYGVIEVCQIRTSTMIVDPLAKALSYANFIEFITRIGVVTSFYFFSRS